MKSLFVILLGVLLWVWTPDRLNAGEIRYERILTIGSEGSDPGQFMYVEDMALDSKGRLLVTDAAHAFVQAFDPTSGVFIARFGGRGYGVDNLEKPEGISVAPDGRIFVADYTTGEVKIYDADYTWIETFGEYGSGPGQIIKSEFSDIFNGRYYVPEAQNHRISVWDLKGTFLFSFGAYGEGEGQLDNPEAAKFNSKGELFVSDMKNHRLQVFDSEGTFLRTIGSKGREPGRFNLPTGIGIDRNDNVYIGEIGNNRVQVLSPDGHFIGWMTTGEGPDNSFGNIHGVFVDRGSGWVYVADTAHNRIQVFRTDAIRNE